MNILIDDACDRFGIILEVNVPDKPVNWALGLFAVGYKKHSVKGDICLGVRIAFGQALAFGKRSKKQHRSVGSPVCRVQSGYKPLNWGT